MFSTEIIKILRSKVTRTSSIATITTKELDDEMLYEAIKATFDNCKLAYNANLQLFNDDFCTDEMRLKRWEVFLKKIQWKESLSFANVMGSRFEGKTRISILFPVLKSSTSFQHPTFFF